MTTGLLVTCETKARHAQLIGLDERPKKTVGGEWWRPSGSRAVFNAADILLNHFPYLWLNIQATREFFHPHDSDNRATTNDYFILASACFAFCCCFIFFNLFLSINDFVKKIKNKKGSA